MFWDDDAAKFYHLMPSFRVAITCVHDELLVVAFFKIIYFLHAMQNNDTSVPTSLNMLAKVMSMKKYSWFRK